MTPIRIGAVELATPGDVAVGGLAYAIGFGVDAFFFSHGVTSGATAGACAAGALGAKYSIVTLVEKIKERKAKK